MWEGFLETMKANVTEIAFETWFKPLVLHKVDQEMGIVYIATENNIQVMQIKKLYEPMMCKTFNNIISDSSPEKQYKVIVKEKSEFEEQGNTNSIGEIKLNKDFRNEKLFNPKYNFSDFVVGSCNKYAHAASVAVAESPGEVFNPFFLYGGSGLGKTHLMQAIGVHIGQTNPSAKVLYVSSEMFLDEFIKALSEGKMSKFQNKYRKVDVLLIDDIQFLEGKDQTQEEFFHTFEALYNTNKQIVITSDCPPNNLSGIDERLRTRFNWNMIADIQSPDYETRVAILRKLAVKKELAIDEDLINVCSLIAEQIKDNIRELEGAFNRVVGFSQLLGEKVTVDYAKTVLKDIISDNAQAVVPERIRHIVATHYNITVNDMDSKKRTAELAYPRQVAMYLCRSMTDLSLPKIGKLFGGRHYATVIHAVDKIKEELKYNNDLGDDITAIKRQLGVEK